MEWLRDFGQFQEWVRDEIEPEDIESLEFTIHADGFVYNNVGQVVYCFGSQSESEFCQDEATELLDGIPYCPRCAILEMGPDDNEPDNWWELV